MTLDELKKYDGKDGRPAYIAYKGKIYDLSKSDFWAGGTHMGIASAGEDVTDQISLSPHGEGNIFRFPVVGELDGGASCCSTTGSCACSSTPDEPKKLTPQQEKMVKYQKLYKKFHPHPITVHFPMGIIPFAFMLQVFSLCPTFGPMFTFASVIAVAVGTLFLIPAICSGTLSYVINYNKTPNVYLKRKMRLSVVVLILGIFTSIYGYNILNTIFFAESIQFGSGCFTSGGCFLSNYSSCVYGILTLVMTGLVMAIGYNGGKITWPQEK